MTSQASTNGVYNISLNGNTGEGWFAAGNLAWDASGNVTVRGKLESNVLGNRVVIDPSSNDKLSFINASNRVVGTITFVDNRVGLVLTPTSQITVSMTDKGFYYYNNGKIFSVEIDDVLFIGATWPTQAEAPSGAVYKDSSGYLRVK